MANVLNKTTLEFRRSVNTPDYDEADWLINPDLTQVADLDSRYWVLETHNVDGDEIHAVVPMTEEQRAEVDNEGVKTYVQLTALDDGTPAYFKENTLISASPTTLVFAVKGNAKKFIVPHAATGQNYVVAKNSVITRVTCSTQGSNAFDLVVMLEGEEAQRFAVSEQNKSFDCFIRIARDEALSLRVDSSQNVINPVVLVDLHSRN